MKNFKEARDRFQALADVCNAFLLLEEREASGEDVKAEYEKTVGRFMALTLQHKGSSAMLC